MPRLVEPPDLGVVDVESIVGGLHHRHFRQATLTKLINVMYDLSDFFIAVARIISA